MPGLDRTGPSGEGPLTGRGLGPCGRGLAFRRGSGRGQGRSFARAGYQVELSKEDENKILEAELKQIELEKKEIEKRMKELKE